MKLLLLVENNLNLTVESTVKSSESLTPTLSKADHSLLSTQSGTPTVSRRLLLMWPQNFSPYSSLFCLLSTNQREKIAWRVQCMVYARRFSVPIVSCHTWIYFSFYTVKRLDHPIFPVPLDDEWCTSRLDCGAPSKNFMVNYQARTWCAEMHMQNCCVNSPIQCSISTGWMSSEEGDMRWAFNMIVWLTDQ